MFWGRDNLGDGALGEGEKEREKKWGKWKRKEKLKARSSRPGIE